MSKIEPGCAGWAVAGFLAIVLLGKCVGDQPSATSTSPQLAASPSAPTAARYGFVQSRTANCRAGRSTQAAIVARLDQRDYVGIVREEGGWSLTDKSPECWIRSDLLGPNMPPYAPARPQRAYSSGAGGSGYSSTPRRSRRYTDSSCPCSGNNVCIGPRGGRYCITSGGNKRYGV